MKFSVIDAPSILGLRPTGVERLPEALKSAGLLTKLNALDVARVEPLPYSAERDPDTHALNGDSIRTFSRRLAEAVTAVLERGHFPIVLGGDCSILIGCVLAIRRLGRYGLFFMDGHADFYQPEASQTREVADMDLAIVSGRGPDVLTNIDGFKPLVRDEDIIAFGYRDAEQQTEFGSQDVRTTAIHAFDLGQVRAMGVTTAAQQAVEMLQERQLAGFWIHLDADILDDAIMPAVDYRLEDGLQWDELRDVLQVLMSSEQAVGMGITIFNPRLDEDGAIARKFVECVVSGLSEGADAR